MLRFAFHIQDFSLFGTDFWGWREVKGRTRPSPTVQLSLRHRSRVPCRAVLHHSTWSFYGPLWVLMQSLLYPVYLPWSEHQTVSPTSGSSQELCSAPAFLDSLKPPPVTSGLGGSRDQNSSADLGSYLSRSPALNFRPLRQPGTLTPKSPSHWDFWSQF